MLVLVTLASVLMAFLQVLHAPAEFFLLFLLFVAGVLSGQVLLFRGQKPMAASAWVGAFLLPAEAMIAAAVSRASNNAPWDIQPLVETALLGCICTVPAGIVLGTVAGITGGRLCLGRRVLAAIVRRLAAIELQRVAADDIDLLLTWIPGTRFLHRWSGGQLTFPVDRRQLLQRLKRARRESFRPGWRSRPWKSPRGTWPVMWNSAASTIAASRVCGASAGYAGRCQSRFVGHSDTESSSRKSLPRASDFGYSRSAWIPTRTSLPRRARGPGMADSIIW